MGAFTSRWPDSIFLIFFLAMSVGQLAVGHANDPNCPFCKKRGSISAGPAAAASSQIPAAAPDRICTDGTCRFQGSPNPASSAAPVSSNSAVPAAGGEAVAGAGDLSQLVSITFNAGLGGLAVGQDWGALLTGGTAGNSSGGAFLKVSSRETSAPSSVQFKNSSQVITDQLNVAAQQGTLRDGMVVYDPVVRAGQSVVNSYTKVAEGIYMAPNGALYAKESGKDYYQPVVRLQNGDFAGAAAEFSPEQKKFFEDLKKLEEGSQKEQGLQPLLAQGEKAVTEARDTLSKSVTADAGNPSQRPSGKPLEATTHPQS